jgi:1,4-alpha-glucan branching enzyme
MAEKKTAAKKKTTAKKATVKKKTVAKKKAAAPRQAKSMAGEGIRKQYVQSRGGLCKATFVLPREAAMGAESVTLVGDFNGWDTAATPMTAQKTGDFCAVVELSQGREYCFRFLINGTHWENHWRADAYRPNAHGGDDSVIVT